MYLKRLELHGFKTFADRTDLEFTLGITAIVGPNGSGKSNVFDAIRWALGEMSVRSLRSGRMDEIIFAGSDGRRAMGLAEVSLTINNDSGVLPVEFGEVTVTRRAIRGEEGECLLNDTRCRLRDIQMLFLGTGLGGRSYSLIGQGQVDSLLNAGPDVRRALLEEAAGLARYKRRRREAERRLERAAANVLRVQDVLAELEGQLALLREQAEAATAHQAYTKEIRDLGLALHVDDARRIVSNLKRIATQSESVQQELRTMAATASEVGQKIDQDRARAADGARAWEETQRTLLQVVEDLGSRESALQILQERVRATAAQRERIVTEVQRFETRFAQVEEGLSALREHAEVMGARRDDLLEQLRSADEAQAEAILAQRASEDQVAALRDEITDLAGARTRTQHDLARVDARLTGLTEQLVTLQAKHTALTERATTLEAHVRQREAIIADLRRARQEAEDRRVEAADQCRRLEAALAEINEEVRQRAADRQVAASTLALLEDLHTQLAGYERGVREILLAKRQHPDWFAGIRYPVVELLRVAPAHRVAIEAALGRRLYSLIAGTVDDVKNGVTYLRGNGEGSATFLPVELMTPRAASPVPLAAEIVGKATDLVELPNGGRDIVDVLLGDVVVVTSLDAAVALRREGYQGRIVTLDGELLSPDGVISVRGKPDGKAILLGRAEQIGVLRDQLAAIDARMGDLVACRAEQEASRIATGQSLADADATLRSIDDALAEQHTVLSLAQVEAARLPAEQAEVAAALERVKRERAGLEADTIRLREDDEVIARSMAEQEQAVLAMASQMRELVTASRASTTQLTEVRVQLAELAGTLEALRARVDEHKNEGAELTARCTQLHGEIAVLDGEHHLLEHSLEEARRAHQALAELQAATRDMLGSLEAERSALQQRLMEGEAHWRQIQQSLREVEEQAHRLDVRHAQVEAECSAAQRRITEDFGVGWEDVRDVRLPWSRDEALGRIEALRGLIAVLGPVNLRAVDEHQAIAARVSTLRTQADDLERARAALTALIQRIDGILGVRFAQTFAAVNDEFNRLFVRLFSGGRANLLLVDGGTGAEPGIEIEAQLPGKKMRSLSALSGGERVLVALALIFAMLNVHPSPFCIFDEVEAALDDANTQRFTTVLRELAQRTQVLIITHNKGTMEAADILYGVTMEAPGVSKIISMRLTRHGAAEPADVA